MLSYPVLGQPPPLFGLHLPDTLVPVRIVVGRVLFELAVSPNVFQELSRLSVLLMLQA